MAKAVLRPLREDDQQLMEYYLPQDGHVEKLQDAYSEPISLEKLKEVRAWMEEDADDPRIDEAFKVAWPNA